jgi:molecular chaperone GrpE
MTDAEIDDRLKEEIWRRDDFTCGLCGRMVPWEQVVAVPKSDKPTKEVKGLDDLITVCALCVEETLKGPPREKERRRLKRLLQELMEFTDHFEDVIFEEDYEEEVVKLSKKLENLKGDNKLLTECVQEKEKVAIAYKVKMDRALKDLENFKKRAENEIDITVREKTKELFLEMIQSLDNIDRAIIEARKNEDIKEIKNVVSGLLSIRKGLLRSLERNDVEIIDPLDEPFDPREHESYGAVKDEKVYSDTIVNVDMIGFKLNGLVLRPAKVLISKGGPKRPKEERPDLETLDFEIDEDIEELEEAEEAGDVVEVGDWGGENEDDVVVVRKRKKKAS